MILTKKDKILAFIIVFLFLAAWVVLGYLTKSGSFSLFADIIKNPEVLTE